MRVTVQHGDASLWQGKADLIFTHPYAMLPHCLRGVPAIINVHGDKKAKAEEWVGAQLHWIGNWGRQMQNAVYVAHLPLTMIDLSDLVEEEFAPGRGWFPLDLPLRLLGIYAPPTITVWDGFCGRGTVGKACQQLGLSYIGIDKNLERVELAREYLGC